MKSGVSQKIDLLEIARSKRKSWGCTLDIRGSASLWLASVPRANRKEHGNFSLVVLMLRCTGTGCATVALSTTTVYAIALQKIIGDPRWVSRPIGFQQLRGNYLEDHVLFRQNKCNTISSSYRGIRSLRRNESLKRDSHHEIPILFHKFLVNSSGFFSEDFCILKLTFLTVS